jgi:hypothetical protein
LQVHVNSFVSPEKKTGCFCFFQELTLEKKQPETGFRALVVLFSSRSYFQEEDQRIERVME